MLNKPNNKTSNSSSRLSGKVRHFFERSPLYGMTLRKKMPDGLLRVPTDPWPGDIRTARALLEGAFPIGHQMISLNDFLELLTPQKNGPMTELDWIHGFDWLRDLRSICTNSSRKLSRHLMNHWMEHNQSSSSRCWLSASWRPDIMGTRLANWVSLFDFFGSSADEDFHRAFMSSLGRQYHHLMRSYADISDPIRRFRALKGLIVCACSLYGDSDIILFLLKDLEKTLQKQVFSDGGHKSRSPVLQLLTVRDLIDIRSLLRGMNIKEPPFLQAGITAMAPIIRLLRHNDGEMADFGDAQFPMKNEGGGHYYSSSFIDMVLSLSDVKGRPPGRASDMGFDRLSSKLGTVLINTKPLLFNRTNQHDVSSHGEPSTNIMNFEWSFGRQRIVHSGDVMVQLSSGLWIRAEDQDDSNLDLERQTKDGHIYWMGAHNQFFRSQLAPGVGYHHQRQLYLGSEGGDFRGEDVITLSESGIVALRFVFAENTQFTQLSNKIIKVSVPPQAKITKADAKNNNRGCWRLITAGCQEIICQDEGKPEGNEVEKPGASLPTLFLMAKLKKDKRQTIKWAFRQETE
ncbi:MAG: hypothetical protein NTX76_02485 [Alphaproteobacteria bacterium]|nr:hypothetical protein [Alphaproteobacteria bacterium]